MIPQLLIGIRSEPLLFMVVVALVGVAVTSLSRLRELNASGVSNVKAGMRPSVLGRHAGFRTRRAWAARQRRELPVLAGVLARSLRSGVTLSHALGEASDHPAVVSFHPDLAQVKAEWERGESLAGVLSSWGQRCSVDGLDLLVTALVLGIDTGGDRAQVLDRLAVTLGDRLALHDEVKALASQARASAGLITMAPVVLTVVFLVIDPSVVQVMVGTFIGRCALVAGVGLGVANWWWMSAIMRRTLS